MKNNLYTILSILLTVALMFLTINSSAYATSNAPIPNYPILNKLKLNEHIGDELIRDESKLALGIRSNVAGVIVVLSSIMLSCNKKMEKQFPGKSNCY